MARGEFLKELVGKDKAWIGLNEMGGDIKALDYAAGTGLLSLVCGCTSTYS